MVEYRQFYVTNSWMICISLIHFQVICVCVLSCVGLLMTTQTKVHQAPLSMGFSRQEHWSGLPFPSPEDLPHPGIEPASPALAGRFFTTNAAWEAPEVTCSAWNPHRLIIHGPCHGRIISFLKTDFAVCVLPASLRKLLGISEILYIKFQTKISPKSLCVHSTICSSRILSCSLAHGPVLDCDLGDTIPFKISIKKVFQKTIHDSYNQYDILSDFHNPFKKFTIFDQELRGN